MVEFLEDLISIILVFFLIVGIIGFGSIIIEEVENETLYQYECVTLDNEVITCDRVKTTEGGIIGTRDDTSYLIKQYKKVKKDYKDEI